MGSVMVKMETFVSVVLILDKADSSFSIYLKEVALYLDLRYTDFEIIIIDQNQKVFPLDLKQKLLKEIASIRWIKLSFPVDLNTALSAGIENAIGDFVCLLRPAIDPVDIIEGMLLESSNGYDVIVGTAEHPQSIGYKLARKLSNGILHSIDYHLSKNATPVRCLSRRAINTVLSTGQQSHQFLIKVSKTGYPTKNYPYTLLNTSELEQKTIFFGLVQVMELMIFNSTKPLRWISGLGIMGSLLAFIFAIYSIAVNFFKSNTTEGWTSMVFFSSFLFMILFIILAFLGEYMARLINENNNKKSYYISSEETSSVMVESDRLNVLHQS